jgi:hypothetical protein
MIRGRYGGARIARENERPAISAALDAVDTLERVQLADISDIDGMHSAKTLMRILVPGGTGSIGGPVVRELRRRGHAVVALARAESSARRLAALPPFGCRYPRDG